MQCVLQENFKDYSPKMKKDSLHYKNLYFPFIAFEKIFLILIINILFVMIYFDMNAHKIVLFNKCNPKLPVYLSNDHQM